MSDDDRLRRLLAGGGVSPSARRAMVARVRAGGVVDPRVLAALGTVPREEFVAEGFEEAAYADRALPIAYGQTISQPLMVAIMVEALELTGGERVLDIGTGSGYQAAVLAACGAEVVSIERLPALARAARSRLARLGYEVKVLDGDGSRSVFDHAPFDGIVVGAAAPRIPTPLLTDLAVGGRLVIPVRAGDEQVERLLRVRHLLHGGRHDYPEDDLGPCRFVPLIGDGGFPGSDA